MSQIVYTITPPNKDSQISPKDFLDIMESPLKRRVSADNVLVTSKRLRLSPKVEVTDETVATYVNRISRAGFANPKLKVSFEVDTDAMMVCLSIRNLRLKLTTPDRTRRRDLIPYRY